MLTGCIQGEWPLAHLKAFTGALHADGYAGFNGLYQNDRIVEAACWAHVRRKFFDVFRRKKQSVFIITDVVGYTSDV